MRLGVIANRNRSDAGSVLQRLETKAEELGMELITCDESAELIKKSTRVSRERFPHVVDTLMALGGDGTLLYAARVLNGADVPIFGVNLGHLGFLTSLRAEELEVAMDAIHTGNVRQSPRSVLTCRLICEGRSIREYRALNDLVIAWGASVRIANIDVKVDDKPVNIFACDGLIISTPTGSTGHSLSSGGPIVHPETSAIILNVICPHSLSARPVVISDDSVIHLRIQEGSKELILAVDGQSGTPVAPGYELVIQKAPSGINLLTLPSYSYFEVLREKLNWRGSSVD